MQSKWKGQGLDAKNQDVLSSFWTCLAVRFKNKEGEKANYKQSTLTRRITAAKTCQFVPHASPCIFIRCHSYQEPAQNQDSSRCEIRRRIRWMCEFLKLYCIAMYCMCFYSFVCCRVFCSAVSQGDLRYDLQAKRLELVAPEAAR